MSTVVYTALFGDRGTLWSPPPVSRGSADFVAFTEVPREEVGLWQHSEGKPTIVPGTHNLRTPLPMWQQQVVPVVHGDRRTARYYKLMPHKVLSEYEYVIWVDANIRLLVSADKALSWLAEGDFACFQHPDRDCLFDEAGFCLYVGKGNPSQIRRQIKTYSSKGMPRHWGLASTRCVIRRNTERTRQLNEAWWRELSDFSNRDQISLPYVCWRLDLRWNIIPGMALHHPLFWYMKHRGVP